MPRPGLWLIAIRENLRPLEAVEVKCVEVVEGLALELDPTHSAEDVDLVLVKGG